MLSDFFRINLPYGIAKNSIGEWMAFNREYLPLGYKDMDLKRDPGTSYSDLPIYTKFNGITDKLLFELAQDESSIQRDENGAIIKVFLYNDGTNPRNQSRDEKELWDTYFEKLKKLSKLKVETPIF